MKGEDAAGYGRSGKRDALALNGTHKAVENGTAKFLANGVCTATRHGGCTSARSGVGNSAGHGMGRDGNVSMRRGADQGWAGSYERSEPLVNCSSNTKKNGRSTTVRKGGVANVEREMDFNENTCVEDDNDTECV